MTPADLIECPRCGLSSPGPVRRCPECGGRFSTMAGGVGTPESAMSSTARVLIGSCLFVAAVAAGWLALVTVLRLWEKALR